MKAVVLVLMLSFLAVTSVHAGFVSGHDLVVYMNSYDKLRGVTAEDLIPKGKFSGFVLGVYDSYEREYSDENVTSGQVCAVVSKYLKQHPELWHLPAVQLVRQALREAFPK